MTTLARESDSRSALRQDTLQTNQARSCGGNAALLAAANRELARTLSPDPVEFLELHRQRDGE